MNPGPIHWRRVIVSVLLGEAIPILVLVLLVAVLGPSETGQAELFARQAGAWVGPIAGAVTLFILAYWAGARSSRPVAQGALIGILVGLIDFGILFSAGESFALLFAVSNGGKVLAAVAGGWFALKSRRAEARDPSS